MRDPRNPSGEARIDNRCGAPVNVVKVEARDPKSLTSQIKKPAAVKNSEAKYNLFINYYLDKDSDRQGELNHCVSENLKNFDNVIVICTKDDYAKFPREHSRSKITPVFSEDRPTFKDYFDIIALFNTDNNMNVIANLDIVFPLDMLIKAESYFDSDKLRCLALTRHDMLDHVDSQDAWVFKGDVAKVDGAEFTLGLPGSDNRIAYLLHIAGYNVMNPSLTVSIIHHHAYSGHNYIDNDGKQKASVAPPYKLLTPTE
jgi:hypothetical protein